MGSKEGNERMEEGEGMVNEEGNEKWKKAREWEVKKCEKTNKEEIK